MEVNAQSFYKSKLLNCSPSPSIYHSHKPCLLVYNSVSFRYSKINLTVQLQGLRIRSKKRSNVVVSASGAQINPTDDVVAETWLLEPVGDGNTKHIGFKVEMPGAYEIASNDVTVGRLPEKANLVIPVATVSGVHARIQKKGENLLVTDLDSTNGTFINEKRLRPGVAASASPGSFVTFGDTHLAMFRVSKLKNVTAPATPEESSSEESDSSTVTTETAT